MLMIKDMGMEKCSG